MLMLWLIDTKPCDPTRVDQTLVPFVRMPVGADDGNGRRFVLTAYDKYWGAIGCLLGAWLDLLTRSVLGPSESPAPRVWVFIDALPLSHHVLSLRNVATAGRALGEGCGIGIQPLSQLQSAYGNNGAQTLGGECASCLSLRQKDRPAGAAAPAGQFTG